MTLSGNSEGRRNWLVVGLFFLFTFLTSKLSTQLFDTLRLTPEIGTALVFRVVAMAHLSFCILLIFSSLVSATLILFSNPENELLFSLPIKPKKLFVIHFIECMAATGWMVFLFGIPIAVGMGRSYFLGLDYVLVASLSLLGLTILPTAVGIFFLCATFSTLPRHRLKILALILAALGSVVAVHVAGKLDIGVLFRMEFDSGFQLNSILQAIEVPGHPYTPDTLSAQAMAAMARGEKMMAWENLGLLWLENFLGVLGLISISYPLFINGWKRQEQTESQLKAYLSFSTPLFRRNTTLTLCLKDLKFLSRDISEWSQMLVLLTLILVHIVNIRDLPLDQAYLINFVSFVNLTVSGLLLVAAAVRFVYPTFSLEGDGAYLLKTLPVEARTILRSKFWTHALILLILSQSLLFIANRQTGVSLFFSIFSHSVCAVQTLAIVSLALWSALVMPPKSQSSLERAAGSTGGLLFMILASLYITASITFFSAPIYKQLLTTPLSMEFARPLLILAAIYLFSHISIYFFWRHYSVKLLDKL